MADGDAGSKTVDAFIGYVLSGKPLELPNGTRLEFRHVPTIQAVEKEIEAKRQSAPPAEKEVQHDVFFHGSGEDFTSWRSGLPEAVKSSVPEDISDDQFSASNDGNNISVSIVPGLADNEPETAMAVADYALVGVSSLLFLLSFSVFLVNKKQGAKYAREAELSSEAMKQQKEADALEEESSLQDTVDQADSENIAYMGALAEGLDEVRVAESPVEEENNSAALLQAVENTIQHTADQWHSRLKELEKRLQAPQDRISEDLKDVKAYIDAKRVEEAKSAPDEDVIDMAKAVADLCESYQTWLDRLMQHLDVVGDDSRAMAWITDFFHNADYMYPCQLLEFAQQVAGNEISGIHVNDFEERLEQLTRDSVGPAFVLNNRLQDHPGGERGYGFGDDARTALQKLQAALDVMKQSLAVTPISVTPMDMHMLKDNPGYNKGKGTLTDFFPGGLEFRGIGSKVIDVKTWGFKRNDSYIGPQERVVVT